jgi:hypothetical protein
MQRTVYSKFNPSQPLFEMSFLRSSSSPSSSSSASLSSCDIGRESHNFSEGDFEVLDSKDYDLDLQEKKFAASRAKDYLAVGLQYHDTCDLGCGRFPNNTSGSGEKIEGPLRL